MIGFGIRLAISAFGLWLADQLLGGIRIEGAGTLLVAALLYGVVNAIVRPLAVVLTLPITVLTLGLFLLVVNAAMFGLVASFLNGFHVSGFWAALFGAIVVSITSWLASSFIGSDGKYEVLVIKRD